MDEDAAGTDGAGRAGAGRAGAAGDVGATGRAVDVDDLPVALITIDDRTAHVNAAGRRLLGCGPSMDAAAVVALVAPTDRERLAAALTDEREARELSIVCRLPAPGDGAPGEPGPGDDAADGPGHLRIDPSSLRALPTFVELRVRRADPDAGLVIVVQDVTEATRTRQVLTHVALSTWIIDDQARMVWGPVGHGPDIQTERTGTMADRVHPEDLSAAADAFLAAVEHPGVPCTAQVRARHPQREGHWLSSRYEITNLTDDPRVGGFLIQTTDTSEAVEVPSLGRTSGSHLSVAEAAPVGIVLTGPKGLPLYYNEAAMKLLPGTGVRVGDPSLERDWTRVARRSDRPQLRALVEATLTSSEQHSMLAAFTPTDGVLRWLLVTISPRLVEDDKVIGLVTTLQDVTSEIVAKQELEAAQQRLIHLASHDPLTGLVNRAVLAEELSARLDGLTDGSPAVAVLFCDLDGFKSVNDRHGHGAGDGLLAAAAARLRDIVIERDPEAVVARVGGDEFVVVGARTASPDQIDELANALVAGLSEPFQLGSSKATIGLSIGIATARPADDAESVLRRADAAMYEAKAAGRGRAVRGTA